MTTGASWLEPMAVAGSRPLALQNLRTGALLASIVEPAFDRDSRNRGLAGRDALPAGRALVLAPCTGIHTLFMRFAIDVLFARANGEIIRMSKGVRPWRIALAFRAHAVVELPAGAIAASGTRVGDRLALVDLPDRPALT